MTIALYSNASKLRRADSDDGKPVARCYTGFNQQPRSDGAQNREACGYPDHNAVTGEERLGDRMLNDGIGIVRGCQLEAGGVDLGANIGAYLELIQVFIKRVVEHRDQNYTEYSDCKQ
jgi:hypothetical protein